ncbi:hypothetical protein [Borrelia sp. RT5S]|uniref:hypothetical protein n=1 Tax=Borrelia sp. RT5S TaxID=2898581 RepID=UPI001E4AE11A|nr:hypothetical protein [Borrelia sp. RT5S]UGQ16711.1 hypothetical protein LSO06_05170 [Borrelia sp. RT5S]
MSISNQDYEDIKKRIQTACTRIQFGLGDAAAAAHYTGDAGQPIYVADRDEFAVCDKKSSNERIYYKTNRSAPVLPDDLDAHLQHMMQFFLKKTPIGALTPEFAQEGSRLTKNVLITAFSNTNKFCIPDGRSLPRSCYARRVLGISSAPNLIGRFPRHYDYSYSLNLGTTQEDAFQNHKHRVKLDEFNIGYGSLINEFERLPRADSYYWSRGDYFRFVYDLDTGDHISTFSLPYYTQTVRGYSNYDRETRPRNLAYIAFYRYDL